MRKTTVAGWVAIAAIAVGFDNQASAQYLQGDLDANEALGKILAGDGLSPSEMGGAMFDRLSEIRGTLHIIRGGGIQDSEVAEYQRLYNDGLALLDQMSAEVDRTATSAKSRRAGDQIVAGWRSDFIATYGPGASQERGNVDNARTLGTVGTGYFYIPGAETPLRITGNVRASASWIENTHQLGGGTVVTNGGGDGNENFAARFGNYIQRGGIGLDFRTSGDYGGASLGKFPIVGLYGGYEGAWGDADYAGDAMVGYDGVTGVGYTYFEPAPSTGAIAGSAGFGIETQGHLDNSWNRANFGLKIALPAGGATGTRVWGRLGAFYEDLKTSASGDTQLTYGGSPYAGYSQQWDMDAKDRYYGVRTGVHVGFKPQLDGKLKTSIGADLYLGYHSGEGSYYQYSQAGGAPIVQTVDYSKNGFTLGGALSASATYEFAPGWRLGGEAEFSCLPGVTSFFAPQNPNEQADAGFSLEHAARMFIRARLARTF